MGELSWRPEEEPAEVAEQVEKTLRIEFSPSMFQLRELNLKCQTIVEQALIEYENQLIASVPSSSQYIEVIPQRNKVSPSLRAAQRGQNGRQSGYQRRERNNQAKPSSGGQARVWLSILVHWLLIAMTTSLVVIRF